MVYLEDSTSFTVVETKPESQVHRRFTLCLHCRHLSTESGVAKLPPGRLAALEPEASPIYSLCFILFIILFVPLRHSARSKTPPLAQNFAFEASLLWRVVRLGHFIHITHLLLCDIIGIPYSKPLSGASKARKLSHHDEVQF